MAKILVLHGPNLNLLGTREPEIYGSDTLADIDSKLAKICSDHKLSFESFQSNAEHELIDKVHASAGSVDFIIINPGAFTHYSIALRDAFLGINVPFIECHLSNVYKREAFRQTSYFSDIAQGVICGFGTISYELAVNAAIHHLNH